MTKLVSTTLILAMSAFALVGCAKEEPKPTPAPPVQAEQPAEEPKSEEPKAEEPVTTEVVDAVTSPSLVIDEETLLKSVGSEGFWISLLTGDITTDKEIVVEGKFHSKGDETKELARKIALYAQGEGKVVTDRYTLTAPKVTIRTENTKIQGGTVIGDIYVEVPGFVLVDATVEGNIYFATQELLDAFELPTEEGKLATVTGKIALKAE